VEITKTWSGGNPEDYDKIKLQLYRTSEIMTEPEPVSSDYERIVKSETEFVYVFNDLDATDIDGHAYTYFAKEAGAVDDIVTVGQNRYQSAVSGTEISNTYILKRTDVEAKKIWVGGSDARRPEIYFKLYRATEGADTEVVPGTEIKVLKPGTTQVIWEGVEAEAAFNQPYTFSVKEGALDPVTGLFIETAPVDYTAAYDGLVVTNTYIPPKAYPPHLTKTGSKNKPPFLARTGEYSGSAPPAALALLSAAILILIRRRRRSKE
jgi:MYXO-CTERM domain-containing protein